MGGYEGRDYVWTVDETLDADIQNLRVQLKTNKTRIYDSKPTYLIY